MGLLEGLFTSQQSWKEKIEIWIFRLQIPVFPGMCGLLIANDMTVKINKLVNYTAYVNI